MISPTNITQEEGCPLVDFLNHTLHDILTDLVDLDPSTQEFNPSTKPEFQITIAELTSSTRLVIRSSGYAFPHSLPDSPLDPPQRSSYEKSIL